jgi:hypothetical protein
MVGSVWRMFTQLCGGGTIQAPPMGVMAGKPLQPLELNFFHLLDDLRRGVRCDEWQSITSRCTAGQLARPSSTFKNAFLIWILRTGDPVRETKVVR